MKGKKSIWITRAGAAAALALCLALPAAVAQEVDVRIEPAETRLDPGQSCTLFVHVSDQVDSLSCAECFLSFDPSVLSLVSAHWGGLYADSPFPKFFDYDLPAPDTVSVTACVLGYRSYIIPPGSLFELRFEAVDYGITEVSIGRISILDIDRDPVVEDIGRAGIVIVSSQTGETVPPPAEGSLRSSPNPFNPSTTLVLELPEGSAGRTEIEIYDAAGRRVRSLFSGTLPAGRSEFRWDGLGDSGRAAGSGIYFAVSRTGRLRLERKLVLVR